MTVIDASDQILGRLCSLVAKRLLQGEEIVVVNAEKAVMTGSRDSVLREYREKRRIGSQRKGPYFPKMPDRILKRTVRGMLPYQRFKGRKALQGLRVYIGIPEELGSLETERPDASVEDKTTTYITLKELSKLLGARV
ncbi:MAG: 50S ribosomal protein L13 [Candidatus Thermoplasmatota archaeon]|nr:50S ribosomal protein L13 [Candidatus Thermoplasmatota archaeon]